MQNISFLKNPITRLLAGLAIGAAVLVLLGSCRVVPKIPYATETEKALQTRLDSLLNQVCSIYNLPGLAVGVIKGDKIIYAKGFGLRKLGTSDSINARSSFHMASVSKPFVAMAILQLAERGKLSIDSPLIRYIPYFKMRDPKYKKVTIKEMLTHTSGFPDVKDYGWDKPQYDDKALERYIRDSVSANDLLFDPGAQFSYSNMAYDVLAEVIKQTTGMQFETYAETYIFKPCKMSNSTFLVKDVGSDLATSPHVLGNSCHFEVSDIYPYNRSHAGSSTLHSNVEDVLKWEMMIINNGEGIISSGNLKLMGTSQHRFDENSSDGLGFFIDTWGGKKLISHSGGDVGYSSYVGIVPEDSVAIVFMSNLHRFVPVDVISNALLATIYNYPLPELKRPIPLAITPIICAEGFVKAREKYLQLRRDSAEKYDFSEQWLYELGFAFVHLKNLRAAIDVLKLNAESYPNSAYCFDNLGDVYLMNKQSKEAAECYRNALKNDPHCEDCLRKLENIGRN